MVSSRPGYSTCAELELLAARGERPRKDYVELAKLLDADVIDADHMTYRATAAARAVACRAGLPAGQVAEAFLRRHRYAHVLAWADQLGLPLAAAYKFTRSRGDLVMVSMWLSPPKKAVFLRRLKVQSHLRAIISYSSAQARFAAEVLGVPEDKLHLALQPVDDRFWHPLDVAQEDMICAVGSESRDYRTLLRAVRGLDVRVELAVGSALVSSRQVATGEDAVRLADVAGEALPANVRVRTLDLVSLRELYARARFVVVPVQDVDYDAGVTVIAEAMAMGRAVIATRTGGQVDLVRDGEQGLYVPPGDAPALRAAIEHLLARPAEAERLGRAGRALVERRHTLDGYVAQLAAIVRPPEGA